MNKGLFTTLILYLVLGLSTFFIITFFLQYDSKFLVAAILFPVITYFLSSSYFAEPIVGLGVIGVGLAGYNYLDAYFGFLSLTFVIYFILFEVIRVSHSLTSGEYEKEEIKKADAKFMKELLRSEWFEKFKHDQTKKDSTNEYSIDLVEDLVNQNFYKSQINVITDTLYRIDPPGFIKSRLSKEGLMNIHAIATIHSLPMPIVKNEEGLVSVGTQMLINVHLKLKEISSMDTTDIFNELSIASGAAEMVKRSKAKHDQVADDHLELLLKTA